MGTRNLTSVIWQKQTKVAQYGQWDGYPSGNGLTILRFLKTIDLEKFKRHLKKVKFLSPAQLRDRWDEFSKSEWITIEQSNKFKEKYPELHRDTGADILSLIYEGKAFNLQNEENFANDTLFCEWHYLINLDKKVLEVYDSGKLKKIYELNKLPSEEKFLKDLENN